MIRRLRESVTFGSLNQFNIPRFSVYCADNSECSLQIFIVDIYVQLTGF